MEAGSSNMRPTLRSPTDSSNFLPRPHRGPRRSRPQDTRWNLSLITFARIWCCASRSFQEGAISNADCLHAFSPPLHPCPTQSIFTLIPRVFLRSTFSFCCPIPRLFDRSTLSPSHPVPLVFPHVCLSCCSYPFHSFASFFYLSSSDMSFSI